MCVCAFLFWHSEFSIEIDILFTSITIHQFVEKCKNVKFTFITNENITI